jgi:hypothetical protein
MSVLTLEGWVEGGQVRLLEKTALPERTKVFVVVPGADRPTPRLRTPRLADPAQAGQFEMEVTELPTGEHDAEV